MERAKAYINGIEVPMESVTATFGVQGECEFTISFPPNMAIGTLPPGTPSCITLYKETSDKTEEVVLVDGILGGVQQESTPNRNSSSLHFVSVLESLKYIPLKFVLPGQGPENTTLDVFGMRRTGSSYTTQTQAVADYTSLLSVAWDAAGNKIKPFIDAILAQLSSISLFYGEFNEHAKISTEVLSRIGTMGLDEFDIKAQANFIEAFGSRYSSQNSSMSIHTFLINLFELLHLELVAIPKPKKLGNLWAQFMLLPKRAYYVPPVPNVILPGSIRQLSRVVNYLQEPSRLLFRFSGGEKPFWVASPTALMDPETDSLKQESQILPEERWKLVNIQEYSESILKYGEFQKSEVDESKEWSALYLKLMYLARRNRGMDVVTTFNPDVIPGVPAYILSSRGIFKGVVSSVQVTFSYSSASYSRILLTHTTNIYEKDQLSLEHPILSAANKYYLPDTEKSADKLYQTLFSTRSIRGILTDWGVPDGDTHSELAVGFRTKYQTWLDNQIVTPSELVPSLAPREGLEFSEYTELMNTVSANYTGESWPWIRNELTHSIDLIVEMLSGVYTLGYDQVLTERVTQHLHTVLPPNL